MENDPFDPSNLFNKVNPSSQLTPKENESEPAELPNWAVNLIVLALILGLVWFIVYSARH